MVAWLAAMFFVSTVQACNIPVFRYALERWRPDACELIVLFDKPLTQEENANIAMLEGKARTQHDDSMLDVVRVDLSQRNEDNQVYRSIVARSHADAASQFPFVIVRSSIGQGRVVNNWRGPLNELEKSGVFDSPIRRELSRRLLKGDAVVWILVKTADDVKTQGARQLLSERLRLLSKELEIPDGLGLPGSELYSDVPLLLDFSILEIDATDPREQYLVQLFQGFEPDAIAKGDPLLVPVFGRGRALEVLPASRLDAGLIGDLTKFLCGACSCQVKEKNPGFDLLLSTRWDRELFGESGMRPPNQEKTSPTPDQPTLLTIPPGRKSK